MSKNVSDEIIQKQHTDKITATFAGSEQVGKISQHINDITMALTVPREYNRILELLRTIDKHIIDPTIFFAKNEIYKAVNKVSNEVKQDIKKELKKELKKGKSILPFSLNQDDDLKEEILFIARKLYAVSKLRMLDLKDTKECLEKIMDPSNSNKFLDSADKVCQVGKIFTEISHTLKSSFFDPHRSGKDYRQLTNVLERSKVNLTTKLTQHIHLLRDNNQWEEAISVATKWLESVEQNPTILKLIGSIYDQKTNGIDLSNLEPIIKEYYLSLIKNSSYYYLEGFASQKQEVTLDHCKILLKVAEKSGKLKIPDANEVAIKTLKEALKYAVELDEDIYVQHITTLINNIENNNANQNDQLYDTFVGTDNQPLSTTRLYPAILNEPE